MFLALLAKIWPKTGGGQPKKTRAFFCGFYSVRFGATIIVLSVIRITQNVIKHVFFSNDPMDCGRASWIVAWDRFRGHGFRFPYRNRGPSPFLGHKITLTQEIVGSRIHLPISGGPKVAIIREIDDLPQAFALRIDVFSGTGLVSREIRTFGPLKRRG